MAATALGSGMVPGRAFSYPLGIIIIMNRIEIVSLLGRRTRGLEIDSGRILFTATFFSFLEAVEEAAGVHSRQGFQAMWLAFFNGVAGDGSFGGKRLRFPLHFRMPAVFVVLADVHENAHPGNGLELSGSGVPQISGESSDRQEVLRIRGGDMEGGDTAVGGAGDVELVVLDFVVRENGLKEIGEDASAFFEEQLIVGGGGGDHDV